MKNKNAVPSAVLIRLSVCRIIRTAMPAAIIFIQRPILLWERYRLYAMSAATAAM